MMIHIGGPTWLINPHTPVSSTTFQVHLEVSQYFLGLTGLPMGTTTLGPRYAGQAIRPDESH